MFTAIPFEILASPSPIRLRTGDFTCCLVWLWNFVSCPKGKHIKDIWQTRCWGQYFDL